MTPTNDTYEQHRKCIWKIVMDHVRKFGGEPEELFGVACLHFVQCMMSYDAEQGAISTFLHTALKRKLIEHDRKGRAKKRGDQPTTLHKNIVEQKRITLSEKALWLIDQYRSGDIRCRVRHKLEELLLDCGWSEDAIHNTFEELESLL